MKKTAFVLVCLILALPLAAARKVPVTFDDYHGYTGSVAYLKAVASAYPDIAELLEIGKSTMGRSIYVLVLTNRTTGTTIDSQVQLRRMRNAEVKNPPLSRPFEGKPGQWIDGGTHGNEYTGTEVCLYIIDKLVAGYGETPEITRLLDAKTIYVCPTVNPDGVFNSAERELSQRGNSALKDDDGDGKVNEDGPDDLSGDGHITQFRHKDPKGSYVIDDKDPRLMVRLGQNESTTKVRYSVVTEDKDNDGDGKRGEDSEAGFDVNRNFPEGWWTEETLPGGTGEFATSSPEARALVEFAVTHRNILMVQNFHTSGGFTYRVPGTSSDATLAPKDVAVYDYILGKAYLEILGEPLPEAWANPDKLAEIKAKMRSSTRNKYALDRGYEMPRAWIPGYNEVQDRRYGYGMVIDWWYQQYGAYAVTTELWNPAKDIPDFEKIVGPAPAPAAEGMPNPEARLWQERSLLKYQDAKYGGKLFVNWKSFKHPELGEGEIGGWIPTYRGNALPGDPLREVCEKHWKFELFRSGLLPQVVITEAQAKVLYTTNSAKDAQAKVTGDTVTIRKGASKGKYKIVEVTAVIENQGPLATQSVRGSRLEGNREDVVWLGGDRDKVTYLQGGAYQRLGTIDGTLKIPGIVDRPAAGADQPGGSPPQMMPGMPGMPRMPGIPGQRGRSVVAAEPPQTGTRRAVKWLVAVEDDAPLKVVVSSQKGGTMVKELTVR